MAKFAFQFETAEYSEYCKATCGFDALVLLNKLTQEIDGLQLKHELTDAVSADIGRIISKIDTFLNTLE
jgi:hypothetical protein